MDPSKALDFFKLPPPALIAIAGVSAILLFASTKYTDPIGVSLVGQTYRPIIGVVFLLALALLVVNGSTWLFQKVCARRRHRVESVGGLSEDMRHRLEHLAAEEKRILAKYVLDKLTAQFLKDDDYAAQDLLTAGLIHPTDTKGVKSHSFERGSPYSINPAVRDYLTKNQQFLAGA